MTTVRIRGIYTTALTRLLETTDDLAVVQPSEPIRDRFDRPFDLAPAAVSIETTRDRQGVAVSGDPETVDIVASSLASLAIDAFRWAAEAPHGAIFDAEVLEASGGSGAVVDLGDGARGYLRYDDVDGYVDAGNRYRVQVRAPTPPWADDRPLVHPDLEVGGGLVTLTRGRTGVTVASETTEERAAELVGMTDLLSADVPDGWGVRWSRVAAAADLAGLDDALGRAVERVTALEGALAEAGDTSDEGDDGVRDDTAGGPGLVVEPEATSFVWFGRESRFALDAVRRQVVTTMPGHHRIKAAERGASAAVDFAEAVCASALEGEAGWAADGDDGEEVADDAFPFAAVTRQFGPTADDRLELGHGKPDGRLISLGTGTVTDWEPDGSITLERSMRGGGTYDALDVPIAEGDVATTNLREGRWWYPTTYRDAAGEVKGTYVNVCTPVELFPDCARYVDLYVDVIRRADGAVQVVDGAELDEAVGEGLVSEELAEKARNVARAVERALSS